MPSGPLPDSLLPVAVPFLLWQATDPYLRLDGLTLLMRPKNSGIGRLRADPRSGAGFGRRRLAGGPARGADGRPREQCGPSPAIAPADRPEVSAERRGRKRNLPRVLPLVDRLPYHSPRQPRGSAARGCLRASRACRRPEWRDPAIRRGLSGLGAFPGEAGPAHGRAARLAFAARLAPN